jgi:hypothetical protein
MRIESKVVLIDNYDNCQKGFFHFDWNLNYEQLGDCRAFLLDFALFHNRGQDKSIYGNYTSLFSNFCFEKLDSASQNVSVRTRKYGEEKVYCLTDYNIFHILKSYYLSLWNKTKYLNYLSDLNKSNTNERISAIIEFYNQNIDVIDFFEFWNKYVKAYGIDDILDKNLFKKLYSWDTYKKDILETPDVPNETIKRDVTPKIKELLEQLKDKMEDTIAYSSDTKWDKDKFESTFENETNGLFNPYFLRNKIR